MDSLIVFLRATFFHRYVSLVFPGLLILLGIDRSPIAVENNVWLSVADPLTTRMKIALSLVGFSWTLHGNRWLTRRALNPAGRDDYHWNREVVVVTGGSGGIGGQLVRKLEKLGTTVAVIDIIPLTYKPGPKTHYFKCDITDFEAVKKVRLEVAAKCGGAPTVLVANAGIVRGKTLLDAQERDLRMTFEVNVLGLLWCIKAFAPDMIATNHGHILVTSSATAFMTVANGADYSASKAAVTSLVEGLQTELKHRHGNPRVRVSALFPATIATEMFAGIDAPSSAIMPVLKPVQVAERMLQTLLKGESEMVIMPAAANGTVLMRFLPYWMRVGAQDAGAGSMKQLSAAKSS
ncbi:hypothetical protein BDV12DRAFT_180254 [Aspergillus spectabilis]